MRGIMREKMQQAMNHMREGMQSFMTGRYGSDDLSRFCLIITLILFVLSMITKISFFSWIGLLLLIYIYFRMFSKDRMKRYSENRSFVNLRNKTTAKRELTKKHMSERKTHRFYKCPKCRQKVRVPKGRGKICITCPKCRNEFLKKS